jgi:hypothetical protein
MAWFEISGEELTNMIETKAFRKKLGRLARGVMTHGHSASFSVYRRPPSSTNYFSPISASWDEGSLARNDEYHLGACGRGDLKVVHFDLLDYSCTDWRSPTFHELLGAIDEEGQNRTLYIAGSLMSRSTGDFVVLQRTCEGSLVDRGFLADDVRTVMTADPQLDAQTIARQLDIPGYVKSDVLRMRLKRGTLPKFVNPSALSSFGYEIEWGKA